MEEYRLSLPSGENGVFKIENQTLRSEEEAKTESARYSESYFGIQEEEEVVFECAGYSNQLFYEGARDLMLMNSVELVTYDQTFQEDR